MTNLNSYIIDNHLYKVGNVYLLQNETMNIESIINVNGSVFFFCSKTEGSFMTKVSQTKSIVSTIMPINAIVFHNLVLIASSSNTTV